MWYQSGTCGKFNSGGLRLQLNVFLFRFQLQNLHLLSVYVVIEQSRSVQMVGVEGLQSFIEFLIAGKISCEVTGKFCGLECNTVRRIDFQHAFSKRQRLFRLPKPGVRPGHISIQLRHTFEYFTQIFQFLKFSQVIAERQSFAISPHLIET